MYFCVSDLSLLAPSSMQLCGVPARSFRVAESGHFMPIFVHAGLSCSKSGNNPRGAGIRSTTRIRQPPLATRLNDRSIDFIVIRKTPQATSYTASAFILTVVQSHSEPTTTTPKRPCRCPTRLQPKGWQYASAQDHANPAIEPCSEPTAEEGLNAGFGQLGENQSLANRISSARSIRRSELIIALFAPAHHLDHNRLF